MKKGKLIVIEGTDFSGKKTQSELLVNKLNSKGYRSEMVSFPRYGTPTGDIIGDCYLGKNNRIKTGSWFEDPVNLDPKLTCLYYAADRISAIPEIKLKLYNGINIICDRYVESNMGHQCAKLTNSNERNELSDWIEKLEYEMLELPKPNKIIFLYMPFQVTQKLKEGRKESRDAHELNEDHLRKAENAYLELANKYHWEKIVCSIDGKTPRTKEDINEEVFDLINKLLSDN